MVADQLGDALPPDFSASVLQSIPVQAGGLYPISDVWYIDAAWTRRALRIHIAQFAREISEAALDECIDDRPDGIGFACRAHAQDQRRWAVPSWRCWHAWPVSSSPTSAWITGNRHRPAGVAARTGDATRRLSDTALVKLFRAAAAGPPSARPGSRRCGPGT
jgi:hypothetical protein